MSFIQSAADPIKNDQTKDDQTRHDRTSNDRTSNDKTSPQPQPEQLLTTIQACAERTGKIRTRKSDGEASEATFLARACSLGFSVATPWGDSNRYDLLVQHEHADASHGFWRIQVKSSQRYAEGRYRVRNGGNQNIAYTSDEIDFIAAHIVPLDLWYIVPIQAVGLAKGLRFYPRRNSKGRFEKYREAWCLLACAPKARGWEDIPVLCRYPEINGHCEVCPLLK
jgi:hypothetical protein